MENNLVNSVVTVLTALVGVAIIAVLVSKNADTSNVIAAGAKGFADDLKAAVSPVSGNTLGGGVGNITLPN